jgi:hypothetical protein
MDYRKILLGVSLLACVHVPASAQWNPAPLAGVWVNPGFYSVHFDRDAGLRSDNPGIGVEWPVSRWVSLTAGRFRNSDNAISNYAGAYVMPWNWGSWRFGAVVGGFDGYPKVRDGAWFPALIPVVAYESRHWGLNVGVVPEIQGRLHGAISFQLKFRLEAPAEAPAGEPGGTPGATTEQAAPPR